MASILVLEYATSGFSSWKEFRAAMEGYAMLKCISRDLSSKHNTTIMVSSEIQNIYPIEADEILLIGKHENPYIKLKRLASQFNYTIVIAPAQKLPEIIGIIERAGGKSIGPCLEVVKTCSNKYLLYKALRRENISTPKTVKSTFKLEEILMKTRRIKPPFVIKPVDGVGCIGVSLINNISDTEKAIIKAKNNTLKNYFIIQEFIDGVNASACIVGDGLNVKVLSINLQYVDLKPPEGESSYNGGLIPIKLDGKILNTLVEATRRLKCLNGFIGLDFIISNNIPYIVDVNPRITTSYIGLRRVVNINIPNMVVNRNVDVNIEYSGYSIIRKIKAKRKVKVKTLDRFIGRDNVFINPIVVLNSVKRGEELALITANSITVEKTEREVERLKLEVEDYFNSKSFINV
ncbi:MAG: ATP-grasp domain-containing protein [Candidatus Methanomethylicia archaeon]